MLRGKSRAAVRQLGLGSFSFCTEAAHPTTFPDRLRGFSPWWLFRPMQEKNQRQQIKTTCGERRLVVRRTRTLRLQRHFQTGRGPACGHEDKAPRPSSPAPPVQRLRKCAVPGEGELLCHQ